MKLTHTQLVLLSAASQRDDRALERPSNLTGGAAGKVIAKLLAGGLIEEIQSRGSLPVWRRDEDGGRSLRVTREGLRVIGVEDEPDDKAASGVPKKPAARSASRHKSTEVSRHSRRREADRPARSRADSKQAKVVALFEPSRWDDNRGHHEGDGMATALGAGVLRRCNSQEAGADAGLGEAGGRARVPHRQSRDPKGQDGPQGRVSAVAQAAAGIFRQRLEPPFRKPELHHE